MDNNTSARPCTNGAQTSPITAGCSCDCRAQLDEQIKARFRALNGWDRAVTELEAMAVLLAAMERENRALKEMVTALSGVDQ